MILFQLFRGFYCSKPLQQSLPKTLMTICYWEKWRRIHLIEGTWICILKEFFLHWISTILSNADGHNSFRPRLQSCRNSNLARHCSHGENKKLHFPDKGVGKSVCTYVSLTLIFGHAFFEKFNNLLEIFNMTESYVWQLQMHLSTEGNTRCVINMIHFLHSWWNRTMQWWFLQVSNTGFHPF